MNTSDLTQIDCWNCGRENGVVYGGDAQSGIVTCEKCDSVIAEAGIDTLTMPRNSDEAMAIRERHDEFTLTQRIKRRLSWR